MYNAHNWKISYVLILLKQSIAIKILFAKFNLWKNNQRIRYLVATLVKMEGLDEFCKALYDGLCNDFNTDAVIMRWFNAFNAVLKQTEFVEYELGALFFKSNKCGMEWINNKMVWWVSLSLYPPYAYSNLCAVAN